MFETAKAARTCGLALLVGTVIAPGLQGQTPGDMLDSTAVEDRPFSVSLGMRTEYFRKNLKNYPPGGSLQMTWVPPNTSIIWLSLQFLRELRRYYTPIGLHIAHDYFGRVRAGFGRGDGPSVCAFYQKGWLVVKETPRPDYIETPYTVVTPSEIGLELGYTFRRITVSYDVHCGGLLPYWCGYGATGVALRYRVF